jgi:hypothetical protein
LLPFKLQNPPFHPTAFKKTLAAINFPKITIMKRKFFKIKRSALYTYGRTSSTGRSGGETDPTTTMITTTVSNVLTGF